jgi:hypothetical protein
MQTASAALAAAFGIMSGRDAGTKRVVRDSLTVAAGSVTPLF